MTSEITPQLRSAAGLQVRYAETGAGAGETLLLCSPWPESLYAWEQLWPRLADGRHVVAIDLPGFGQSEGRPDLFSAPAMGRFLVTLIEEWGLGAPHVFGPDVGTAAALFAAAASPSSLSSAVIGNGATAYPLVVEGTLKELIANPDPASLLALDGAEVVRQTAALHENFEPSPEAFADYQASYAGRRFGESAAYVRGYEADLAALAPLLAGIETPVQVIAARRDPMVPLANAEYLRERLPHCRLDVLDLGHFAWEDGAQQWGEVALRWLQGGYESIRASGSVS